ncbi:hypothetical protein DFP93_10688 [Aneurinibacillus soli]|uniref:Uncharacterized protein n=1 Tax=Aneurinibacillus soli TaxID=1500254 RepID=A0A0U5B8K5_9BACL|nr:hypothetical protein [Aneurinibacillus soli]PYE61895.1 hypothetical protein DFP93_10688 [Aneurinibacillus soli]BAU29711.1 hypothetical protein CB4_03948 [Aneurinibacillus soli]
MYASILNQLYEMAHFTFSFLLLMVIVPRFLFARSKIEDTGACLFARFLRGVFVYIVIGYVLVLLKLFEVLAIVAVLLLLGFRHYLRRNAATVRTRAMTAVGLLFYETLDIRFRIRQFWLRWRAGFVSGMRAFLFGKQFRQAILPGLLLLAVLAGSAYVRFYDAWEHAAPAMSDGYVTLAWMKYIESRVLFHDGIYPQGFHIILAYLHKFAAIDQVYVLKYMGSFSGVLITLGLYFAVSRWVNNHFAGIAAAALYGLTGEALHGYDWIRQASTNSQEFAMIFVFPTLYFLARYMKEGDRADLWTAAAGCAVTGLVHSLIFGYIGMGLGILIVLGLVTGFRLLGKRVWNLCLAGAASVVIAIIPYLLGKILGREVHGSSEDFLTRTVQVPPPELHLLDYTALAALVVFLLTVLFTRKLRYEKVMDWFAIGIGTSTFLLYEFGGAVTHSLLLATRSSSLWALAIPFSIGIGLHAVWRLFDRMKGHNILQASTCSILIFALVKQTHLMPIIPYKMEWDTSAEQYLRIAESYRPKTWLIVSQNEGYALALGNGYHMYLHDLLDQYDPSRSILTRKGENKPDAGIANDIFIYNEKKVFELSKSHAIYPLLAEKYKQRKKDNEELRQWITTYQASHDNLQIFYEDENLRIYHLHKEEYPGKKQEQVWGKS